jgi:hypothetical protein
MNYYRIEESTDLKIIGSYPQAQKANHLVPVDSPVHLWKAKKIGSKWDNNVSIPEPILLKKAKLTDAISSVVTGGNLIISNKLKQILSSTNNDCIQFIQVNIFYNEKKIPYWMVNPCCFGFENIDFINSEIWLTDAGITDVSKLSLLNINEFNEKCKELKPPMSLQFKKLAFLRNTQDDFFVIRYAVSGYGYVSEKLKNEIEQAGCTGIRFMGINERL